MSPRWLYWPASVSASDYSDNFIAGSSYWIIPAGTTTGQVSKTGGDTSAVWTVMRHGTAPGTTANVQSGTSVTMDSTFNRVIQGGYLQLTNPYNYCAAWFDGTGTSSADPRAPGWIVYEREQTAETVTTGRQTFMPIEVQSGVVGGTITASGYGPSWPLATFDNSLVFFFNSYTSGDVQNWTAWDGVTTP